LDLFLGRAGRIGDVAHQLRNIVIDFLFSPCLALENVDIDRAGVMRGTGPFADDVEDPLKPVGI